MRPCLLLATWSKSCRWELGLGGSTLYADAGTQCAPLLMHSHAIATGKCMRRTQFQYTSALRLTVAGEPLRALCSLLQPCSMHGAASSGLVTRLL
jgi:hypothetical protein